MYYAGQWFIIKDCNSHRVPDQISLLLNDPTTQRVELLNNNSRNVIKVLKDEYCNSVCIFRVSL